MRRTLLVTAAALLPIAVLALVNAQANQLVERTNFSAVTGFSYVNAAQCAGDSPLSVEFNIPGAGSGSFSLFASNTQPAVPTNGTVTLCAETPSPSATPPVAAGPIGSAFDANSAVKDVLVSGPDALKAAGKTCSSAENDDVWLCAHWTNGQGGKDVASAIGHFRLQFARPAAPSNVRVESGDSKLIVRWDASTGAGATADHYIAEAFVPPHSPLSTQDHPTRDPPDFTSTVTGTTATISGLQNDQPYDVYVVALSIGGNPHAGDPIAGGTAIPRANADFWDVYKARGGQEAGGCTSGSGGALALLGVAALAVIRRRKP
ncbi:MAG TPA: fibronectin type III domain-containing protein [Anaeromyxobacter sp.]|nr:fibronectin type III domain-containing protein [Anaeromyxobacter sp.]